jgi:alkaline phosphatase D
MSHPRSVFKQIRFCEMHWSLLLAAAFFLKFTMMTRLEAVVQAAPLADQRPSALQSDESDDAKESLEPIDLGFENSSRPWIGKAFWANPMEDWRLENGVAINTHSGGNRNLALLTAELSTRQEPFRISCGFLPQSKQDRPGQRLMDPSDRSDPSDRPTERGFVGFQIGLKGQFNDYRDSAIYGTGLNVGVTADGRLFIGGVADKSGPRIDLNEPFEMTLIGKPNSSKQFDLTLSVRSQTPSGESPESTLQAEHQVIGADATWLPGLISVIVSAEPPVPNRIQRPRPERVPAVAQRRGGDWRWGVTELSVSGKKVDQFPERAWGPILWPQYSLDNGRLILTAQFAPIEPNVEAVLSIDDREAARAIVDHRSRIARFVVEGLDSSQAHPFEISWKAESLSGTLAAEPSNRSTLKIAALSCNDSTGFPHQSLVRHVTEHQPDLIAFLGDQLYESIGGYGHLLGVNNTDYDDRVTLCYLRKYFMHGWSWSPLLSRIPSITIPDDHDVMHGNIWGEGGKLADRSQDTGKSAQDSGGYKLSRANVNAIHQTQTGNLPAPSDGPATENGVSVYFTRWSYAGIDMAILADRQFKSAPQRLLPEVKVVNGWPQNLEYQHPQIADAKVLDVENAYLLGERQEEFLSSWAQSPAPNSRWRLVFSQSPFACVHTLPEDATSDAIVPSLEVLLPGEYPDDDIVKVDLDANGWPQSRRDFAVEQITRAGAVHIAGDQHLGMTGQHGIEDHNDGAWWITVPATANLWPRRWFPREGGELRMEGRPLYTGQFLDGLGNRVTIHGVANPFQTGKTPARLYDRAVGYGIITLHRDSGHITLENWPYTSSPKNAAPDNQPYPDWPITIDPKTHSRIE